MNINKSFDDVCQDILNKKNTDYCGAYELMKHDKLKSECFKIKDPRASGKLSTTKKKKEGKLRSINVILSKNKDAINDEEESKEQPKLQGITRSKKLVLSNSHLQRLNKINDRFHRSDEK